MQKIFLVLTSVFLSIYCAGQISVNELQRLKSISVFDPAIERELPLKCQPPAHIKTLRESNFGLVRTPFSLLKNGQNLSTHSREFVGLVDPFLSLSTQIFPGLNALRRRNDGHGGLNENRITMYLPSRFDNIIRVDYFLSESGRIFPVHTVVGRQRPMRCFHCYCCPPSGFSFGEMGRNNSLAGNVILGIGSTVVGWMLRGLFRCHRYDTYTRY